MRAEEVESEGRQSRPSVFVISSRVRRHSGITFTIALLLSLTLFLVIDFILSSRASARCMLYGTALSVHF